MSSAELAVRAEAEDYAAWFRALADGTRVKIVSLLARHGRPMKVAEIVAAVQVGQSTVSQHLKVLAAVRFVLAERRGTARYYRINAACVSSFPTAAALVGGLAAPLPDHPGQEFLPPPPPYSESIGHPALLQTLIDSTEAAGIWTIQSGIFPENTASLRLHERKGFRVVGVRERIGCHHGRWRDVVLVERRSSIAGG